MPQDREPVRFTEILTTATAVAAFLGDQEIRARHVRLAVAILRAEIALEDLGPAPSPLARRGKSPMVHRALRQIVQRWFSELGSDPLAELDEGAIQRLLSDAAAAEGGG